MRNTPKSASDIFLLAAVVLIVFAVIATAEAGALGRDLRTASATRSLRVVAPGPNMG